MTQKVDFEWLGRILFYISVWLMLMFLAWVNAAPYTENPSWWSPSMGRVAIIAVSLGMVSIFIICFGAMWNGGLREFVYGKWRAVRG